MQKYKNFFKNYIFWVFSLNHIIILKSFKFLPIAFVYLTLGAATSQIDGRYTRLRLASSCNACAVRHYCCCSNCPTIIAPRLILKINAFLNNLLGNLISNQCLIRNIVKRIKIFFNSLSFFSLKFGCTSKNKLYNFTKFKTKLLKNSVNIRFWDRF